MGYFDKLAENAFKRIDNETVIYYPNGSFGKGRVVPNEKIRKALFSFQKNTYKAAFFVFVPYAWLVGFSRSMSVSNVSPILIFIIIYWARQQYLVRGLVVHDSKLGFKEAAQRGSRNLPNWLYWMLGLLSVAMIVTSILLPLLSNKPYADNLLPIVGVSSAGLLALALSIKMYKLKNPSQ